MNALPSGTTCDGVSLQETTVLGKDPPEQNSKPLSAQRFFMVAESWVGGGVARQTRPGPKKKALTQKGIPPFRKEMEMGFQNWAQRNVLFYVLTVEPGEKDERMDTE